MARDNGSSSRTDARSRIHLSRRARRVALLAFAALVVAGVAWWLATRDEVSTDDAYVNADVAQIAALVSGPVGVSIVATYFSRSAQAHWEMLRGYLTPYRKAAPGYLARLHVDPTSPLGLALLAQEVGRQAQLAAFVDSSGSSPRASPSRCPS